VCPFLLFLLVILFCLVAPVRNRDDQRGPSRRNRITFTFIFLVVSLFLFPSIQGNSITLKNNEFNENRKLL